MLRHEQPQKKIFLLRIINELRFNNTLNREEEN